MALQDWGAIGDFVSGVAVIVSLVYLAMQIRQNTNATKAGAYQQYRMHQHNVLIQTTDPKVMKAYLLGRTSLEEMSDDDRHVFHMAVTLMLNNYESLFHMTRLGVIDHEMTSDAPLKDLFRHRGVQDWWRSRGRSLYPAVFVKHVEEAVFKQEHS